MQGLWGCEGRTGKGRIFFFVNKKEAKKTLLIWARAGENARAPESKSFLLLFFKKEALSSLFLRKHPSNSADATSGRLIHHAITA
jgi:hypothetical protein